MARVRKTTHSRKSATRKATTRRKSTSRARRGTAARKTSRRAAPERWSQRVTRESDALDLKRGVFKLTNPKKIAASLKRSAEHSTRRKSGVYRSALSMLTFYINRAGAKLPPAQKKILEAAKDDLRKLFHRSPRKAATVS